MDVEILFGKRCFDKLSMTIAKKIVTDSRAKDPMKGWLSFANDLDSI